MKLNHLNVHPHVTDLFIDLDTVLDRIFSESAWLTLCHPELPAVTDDQARLIEQRVNEGFADLRERLAGMVEGWNYNPSLEHDNIALAIGTATAPDEGFAQALSGAVAGTLAYYVLMRLYTGQETFVTSWHLYRTRLTILLCRLDT